MGQRMALKRNAETREILRGIKEIEPAKDIRQYKRSAGGRQKTVETYHRGRIVDGQARPESRF